MTKKNYDIFLLDADDTLFDFPACCKNALRRAMELCNIAYCEDDHEKYMRINGGLWKRLERKEITHQDLFELRFKEFLLQKTGDGTKCAQLNDAYMRCLSQECVSFDGAEDFLRELKKRGRICIITNGTAFVQRGRFKKFGIYRYAEEVFISEEIGAYKPSAEYMARVAKNIENFTPQTALIIGDSLSSDVALAGNTGIDCVWFHPQGESSEGGNAVTFEAKSYQAILQFLNR
ncbi:MAG: YjjG family noncanonical pyrimidine nucleotidase [Clostridia bacterium]|nr:YjjG family noncanonical pyrimidine nucleotidase [Clostridia bacterium]